MSSELDPGISDPTPGVSGGSPAEGQQGTPAQQAPAGRTYSDGDMAGLRRSLQAESQREWQRREQLLRQELSQQFIPREQPKAGTPWDNVDAQTAQQLRALLDHEFSQRLTPFRTQQEDITFRNDEAEIRSKFPDYDANRVAVLEYGVENGIANVEQAYRAWKYDQLSTVDPKKIGQEAVAAYLKKKTAQSVQTPASEGRGGVAPSSQQKFKSREEMDEAVLEMIHQADA